MEINEGFATGADIAKTYSEKRASVTEEDAKDLLRIMVKYLKQRVKSNEFYALDLGIGTLYKELDAEAIVNCKFPRTKKEKTEEKLLLNKIFKLEIPKEYNHDEFELLKENTNNHPIKN